MKLLKELTYDTFSLPRKTNSSEYYKLRKASRAIVFNADKEVALIYSTELNLHKLPGGGIETGETPIEALHREVKEEVGGSITNIKEIGLIQEIKEGPFIIDGKIRDRHGLIQQSYCYYGDLHNYTGKLELTHKEKKLGFRVEWYPLEEAISLLNDETPSIEGHAKFINSRCLIALKKVKELIENW